MYHLDVYSIWEFICLMIMICILYCLSFPSLIAGFVIIILYQSYFVFDIPHIVLCNFNSIWLLFLIDQFVIKVLNFYSINNPIKLLAFLFLYLPYSITLLKSDLFVNSSFYLNAAYSLKSEFQFYNLIFLQFSYPLNLFAFEEIV